jgi:hypothetical protein
MRAILILKTEHQKLSTVEAALKHPESCIDGMVKLCTTIPGVSGFNIDWETTGSPSAHTLMAGFLRSASTALHAVNCSLTMDVGDGSSENADLVSYIDATDGLWDMSTYHGTSLVEWRERFAAALLRLSDDEAESVRDRPSGEADLDVAAARLTPRCLEDGAWPEREAWGLSDHGVLTSTFVPRAARRAASRG